MHRSLKNALAEWRRQSLYNRPENFVLFPPEDSRARQASGFGFRVEAENPADVRSTGPPAIE